MKRCLALLAVGVFLILLLSAVPLQSLAASGAGYSITPSTLSMPHGASGTLQISLSIPEGMIGTASVHVTSTSGLMVSGSHFVSASLTVMTPQGQDSLATFTWPDTMTNLASVPQQLDWTVDTDYNGALSHYSGSITIAVEHTYTDSVVPPLCEVQGYTEHTCSVCGSMFGDTFTPALGHDWGNWTHDGATSGAASVHFKVCANDASHIETEPCVYNPAVIAPTCTDAGYTTFACGVCGYSYVGSPVAALGHSPGEWEVVAPATGYAEGEQVRHCTRCGIELDREAIPKLNGMRYGNTACTLGQRFRDMDPALTGLWYMFTPVDLGADGTQSFPLIAANLYYIGSAQVSVKGGMANVTYTLNSGRITVKEEFLTLFTGLDAVTTVLPEEMPERGLPLGADISVADILGEGAKGLLFLRLTIDYDIYADGVKYYHEGMFD